MISAAALSHNHVWVTGPGTDQNIYFLTTFVRFMYADICKPFKMWGSVSILNN